MSLRVRLTLLYTFIVTGILVLFGVAISSLIKVTLVSQIDNTLERTWNNVRSVTRISPDGELVVTSFTPVSLEPNVIVQAWGRDGELKNASNAGPIASPPVSIDPQGLRATEPVYEEAFVEGVHLRVLSVPLYVGDRDVGTLQIGSSMELVDGTLQALSTLLVYTSIITIILAATIGWVSIQGPLSPLEDATLAALEITQSNDLSRRIPHTGPQGDEVDQLVLAFNQNLSRLERLIETQRRFVADVGHELRTPLTVIKGNVNLMQRFQEFDLESLDGIEDEVDRMTRLVGDLMLLAQAEAGKLPMDMRLLELDSILLDVFRQSRVLAKDKISLKIGDIDQVLVCGDSDRLKQVILNLISNGIKYTPEGGTVTVTLGKVDNQACLTVSDNGPGIPQEDIVHIFERFYRGEKSRQRSRDGKGFGLGLSIAYWIVQKHNGNIEVRSQLGQGTKFIVWFPLADENSCEEFGKEMDI
jgi:signal transduction histidine kinase